MSYIKTGTQVMSAVVPKRGVAHMQAGLRQSTESLLAHPASCSRDRPLTLVLLGDIMLGRFINDGFSCDPARKASTFGNVLPYLRDLDPTQTVIAGNLECAITNYKQPNPKAFNFRLSPSNADVLKLLGLHVVSTANNHVLDYGVRGLRDTHKVLKQLDIQHVGSGTQSDAAQPVVVSTPAGHRMAFLAYSDHYKEWAATPSVPGINYINPSRFDTAQLQQHVASARAAGPDLVVVMVHWGPNWCWQPETDLRTLGRAFLAAGADIVFGTSPHHVQGVEVVDGKAIIFSGGAFIDDYAQDPEFRNDLSAVMVAEFHQTSPSAAAQAEHERASAGAEPHSACTTAVASGANREPGQTNSLGSMPTEPRHRAPAWMHEDALTHCWTSMSPASTSADGLPRSCCAQRAWCSPPLLADMGAMGPMALHRLLALPIAITHEWHDKDRADAPSSQPNKPTYFSQVNFASNKAWHWVADTMTELCRGLGNMQVTALRDDGSILLFCGEVERVTSTKLRMIQSRQWAMMQSWFKDPLSNFLSA